MKIKNSIALSENGFLLNTETGESFTLNQTGLSLLHYLREGETEKELLQHLLNEYEVQTEVAERDLHDFLETLRRYKLLMP